MVSHMAKKFNENLIIKNLKKIIAGNIFCTTRKNPTEREREQQTMRHHRIGSMNYTNPHPLFSNNSIVHLAVVMNTKKITCVYYRR